MIVLVMYHSRTGKTRALAEEVTRGVEEVEGVACSLKPAAEVSAEDFIAAAGIVAGSPGTRPRSPGVWPARLTGASLWPLAFQTVVITFASYLVWFWLVRHYPATRISAFTLLTPVFGLLAGVGLLGEPLTLRLGVALVAVCAGIWLVNRVRPAGQRQR